jgi:N-methylhydantoinase B
VGYGARPYADGIDAVYYVAQKNYPCEFIELSYPVRMRRYGLNCDSGGPGRWRGGCGVIREIELLSGEAILGNRIESVAPWGVNGGMAGRPGHYTLNPGRPDERVLPSLCDGTVMRKGDVLLVETGGGWGHPFDREPERMQRDVMGGFVSLERAREDYGVVLAPETFELDLHATGELRRKRRWPTKLFHRGDYYDGVDW